MECFVRKKGNCFLGRYLLGLLDNGEIFVWHKDKDVVKFVAGFDRQEESFSTGSTLWHRHASPWNTKLETYAWPSPLCFSIHLAFGEFSMGKIDLETLHAGFILPKCK